MRVLIAEDDAVSQRLLRSYLEKWGHEVAVARDGGEAWARLAEGEYSIVLSDWMMPELDGLELIRRIRARPSAGYVYCILLTSRAQKEDLVAALEAGADDFLTKPFDRDELRVRLRAGERILALQAQQQPQQRGPRALPTATSERRGEPLTRARLRRWAEDYVALWNAGDRDGWTRNWRALAPGELSLEDPPGSAPLRGFEACALRGFDENQRRFHLRAADGALLVCGNELAWLLELTPISDESAGAPRRWIETIRFAPDGGAEIRRFRESDAEE
jgi:DNA-binding response OmpR family regulator